ncbi:E3 ubiquitin-protein ligase TRIM39-like [Bufo gargarizans]|uniref:E3 ubiquitin-protein ligase TRIM39-like n=1 Tax=Bufo gargarizans TaxID=30331 RepID=UPI001CF4FC3E|nr:E3 ubiquitin-protein ligase TRIM39-like [Bufo gargarizans]
MASADLRAELDCSICLSLYTDPVSLRCGHNFCRSCIVSALDAQEAAGVYSCPDCRAEYRGRPALEKNRKLGTIMERFLSAQSDMEETGIFCTYCDSPVPAVRTCLQCETSMCHKHLGAHNKSVNHSLIKPTVSFLHRKCSTHNEILKYYCPMDAACICVSCWVAGDHKGHDVELPDVASEKEKEKLRPLIEKLKSEREEAGRRIQRLKDHKTEQGEKSTRLAERVTGLFTDIREKLEDLEKRIQGEISRQKEQVSLSVSDLVRQAELQKYELTKKINQFEGLCVITDPLILLQEDLKTCDISDRSGDVIRDVRDAQCLDEGLVSQILHRGLLHFADDLIDLKIKRQFPVMEKSDVLLDTDTAHNNIILSQDLRSASYTTTSQDRPDLPQKFISCQVLSSRSFSSGRHYWEVDVSRAEKWIIGVAEESLERKVNGNESYIGYNVKSWGLELINSFGVCHNKIFTKLVSDSPVKVVGIYLDYEAGRLSFYQLCDPIRHLHTFTASFSEPLYAAFYLFKNSSIIIVK